MSNSKQTRKRTKQPKKKTAKRRTKASSPAGMHAKMIADPCNSMLVPGLYGANSGLLARFRSQLAFPEQFRAQSFTYGYILWFPSLHNNATSDSNVRGSLYIFGSPDAGTNPTLLNYGVNNASVGSAQTLADPAFAFVDSDLCADARTLSACLKLTYTGSQSGCKGLVAPLTNVPLSVVLQGGSGGSPPKISELLNYTTVQGRPLDDHEAVWRPDPSDNTYKPTAVPLIQSVSGTNSLFYASIEPRPPTAIGFVFYNVSQLTDFNISAFKNIEWRPEPFSGLTAQAPSGSDNPGVIAKAVSLLDNNFPGWQTKVKDTAINVVGNALTKMVLGGSYRSGNAPQYMQLVN